MKMRLVAALALTAAVAVVLSGSAASAEDTQTEPVSTQASSDDGWRYNTFFLFPLTRHMKETELPEYGQYILYPFAVGLDIIQFPVGALGGLLGE